MGTESEIRYIPGSLRYKGNTDKDPLINVGLNSTYREFIEGDRTATVNLEERFDYERQLSNVFRVAGKITNLFENSITGKTSYAPFRDTLYYIDEVNSVNTGVWKGYPQGMEFTFFRKQGISGHTTFIPKSASTYNWNVYLSYPFSSSTTQIMSYTDEVRNVTIANFQSGDGVPFVIENRQFDGKPYIYFYCGTKHNLRIGEWVELSFSVNGKNVFQVYDLGDENYGSEDKVFALYNLGYPAGSFIDGTNGTLKRIIDIQNSAETKSRYYVRVHKLLTDGGETDLTKMGFENNIFGNQSKLEYSALTPNNIERVSMKNDSQSFSFSFDKDIDVTGLLDANKKPVKELFVTIVQKGYMGWFNRPFSTQHSSAIDIGWDFNFMKNSLSNWWDHNSFTNKDNIPVQTYVVNGNTFYYNQTLSSGSTLIGDFCEYNELDQTEVMLSELYHKYSYNSLYFEDNSTTNLPSGYGYQAHYPVPIRSFSDYIETADPLQVDNVPDYAYFSEYYNQWLWRDLYPYGFTDESGNGVDVPFLNGAHYPFKDILFLQVPMIRDVNGIYGSIIIQPLTDDCE